MTTLTVPAPADAQATIAQCISGLPFGPVPDERREQIMKNCLGPVVLLIEAVQLAGAAGAHEEEVLIQFIRRLYAQSESARREKYFVNLMNVLSTNRPAL